MPKLSQSAEQGQRISEKNLDEPPRVRRNHHIEGREVNGLWVPAIAFDPDLMERVAEDYQGLGVAGEKQNCQCLYLVGTSRLLDKPLSGLVQGASSTGKSFLIEKTEELRPPEKVLKATRMTPQAIYHLQEPIAHKLVVGGERSRVQDDAYGDATAALRKLRSEGTITKQITEKKGSTFVTNEVTVTGPIAFMESTTLDKSMIFQEDLNRDLTLKTINTEEQNVMSMVKMAKANAYGDGEEQTDTSEVTRRHRDLQRSLVDKSVYISYAVTLAKKMPATEAQCRRVFGQVLAMIEAVAVLHQHQRRRTKDGRIIATERDYEIARDLLIDPLWEAIGLSTNELEGYRELRLNLQGQWDSNAPLLPECSRTR
jgi:hypothetical protein